VPELWEAELRPGDHVAELKAVLLDYYVAGPGGDITYTTTALHDADAGLVFFVDVENGQLIKQPARADDMYPLPTQADMRKRFEAKVQRAADDYGVEMNNFLKTLERATQLRLMVKSTHVNTPPV